MKKTIKIAIGISILLLTIGSAAALELPALKTLDGYMPFDDAGFSNYTTNSDRYFNIEKITVDDTLIQDYFTNNTDFKYQTNPLDGNIWYFTDDTFEIYGYQEVVNINGTDYMVSINQNSKLSPSEQKGFLEDLKDLNKLNNLEPVDVV